ncbi:MAG: septum formation protein Maf [Candidatus Hydrogenedentes bacterium]|nr:septum formation protein Maf [Candidatus Hydrogenedentota bacterium]
MTPIILASASPRRRALLQALGIEFEVVTSDAPETNSGASPESIVIANARIKRDDVCRRLEREGIVIAADTLVFKGGHVLGKPATLDEARQMLRQLSGHTHQVVTGIAIVNTSDGRECEGSEVTDVHFRPLPDHEIDRFVEIVRPTDRAGAYTVDGPGSLLVERYDGCYQNVLGLPMVRLHALLQEIGVDLYPRMHAERAAFL